jgi:single-strand DNA-binding protein
VAFGKSAEFNEKYCHKGTKLLVSGRIQTGSYTNRDGQKVCTTDIVIEEQEFAESKTASSGGNTNKAAQTQNTNPKPMDDGFMNIPDGIDEELPFR